MAEPTNQRFLAIADDIDMRLKSLESEQKKTTSRLDEIERQLRTILAQVSAPKK